MQFNADPIQFLQADPGSALNLKPAEIIMSGVISPSFAGAAVKNNVTRKENEGDPGGDGSNANEEQRGGTAEHNLKHTHTHTHRCLEIVTELKFKLKKKEKKIM